MEKEVVTAIPGLKDGISGHSTRNSMSSAHELILSKAQELEVTDSILQAVTENAGLALSTPVLKMGITETLNV